MARLRVYSVVVVFKIYIYNYKVHAKINEISKMFC